MTKFLNISKDNTLGGSSASDEVVSSQKAVKEYVDSKVGSTTWGNITGTLSDQTDLQNALNAKANDSNVVHKTGNENIAGNKTFTGNTLIKNTTPFLKLQSSDIAKGTAPSSNMFGYLSWYDKNGTATENRLGNLEFSYRADGGTYARLFSYKPESGSTSQASVSVYYPASGSPYATAPAPTEDTTSSTQIDTVGARNTKLQSYALDSDVVKTSGNQTIGGEKTFTSKPFFQGVNPEINLNTTGKNHLWFKNTLLDKTATQTGNSGAEINFIDKNDGNIALLRLQKDVNGNNSALLIAYKNNSNTAQSFGIYYDATEDIFRTVAPASDVNNSIVTTTGISKASNGYVKLGNGIIIQWGREKCGSGTSQTLTFPTSFTSTNYAYVGTVDISGATGNYNSDAFGGARTKTSITVYCKNGTGGALGTSLYFQWVAIGY